MTTVQDTVYRADGTSAQGTLLISWPAFTTAGGGAIAAGTTSVNLGAGGALSVALAPNASATPANSLYTVVYQLDDGTVKTEYWIVPTTSPATLAAVRTTLGATTSVAQMATQQFVTSALVTKANDSAVVHLAGTETISGTKQFSVSPSMPTPSQPTDAVNKAYVDGAVQNTGSGSYLSTSGGTLTGPLTLNGDPVAPNQASTKHYVDISSSVKADLIGGLVPPTELASGTPGPNTCLLGNQTWGTCGAGGSSSYINSELVANPNFNSATPAAQSNFLNCSFQNTASSVSLQCPYGNTSSTFALGSQAVLTNQGNTYGTGLQDFSAASLKLPSGPGYTPSTAGAVGFDTNANAPVINISGVTQQLALTTSNISGQANTALALAATPAQCNGSFATGVQANGNANCSTADVIQLAETTQPSGIPNYGIFWFDSATHTPRVIDNNGQVVQLALLNVFNSDANTLEEYNGTTPQTFNVYGTRTDAADYERVRLGYDTSDGYFVVSADAAGTGSQRGLGFWLQGSLRWVVDASFNFKPWSDNSKDIGTSTLRVHNLYLGTGLIFNSGTLSGVHGTTGVAAEAGTLGTTAGAGLCNDGNGNVTDQGCTLGAVSSVFGRSGVVVPQSGDYSVAQITGAAPLASPALTGTPTAPTPAVADNSTKIATTAWVQSNFLNYAELNSPGFTGIPTAPTPPNTDSSTKIATTAWVNAQGYGTGGGNVTGPASSTTGNMASFSGTNGKTIQDSGVAVSSLAPLASPTFSGTPTAPTPATADSSGEIATTAYVQNQGYATLNSPAFRGTPTSPTQTAGDSSPSIATDAFVQNALAGPLSPSFFGPGGAFNNICVIDGVTHTTWQSCVDSFYANGISGGTIWDYDCTHDVSSEPFRQSSSGAPISVQVWCGNGSQPSSSARCGTSNVNCMVMEVPLILPYGTRIHGSGRVAQTDQASQGTAFVNGANFPTALGPVAPLTATCGNNGDVGAALSNGTYHLVATELNSLDPSGRVKLTPGFSAHSTDTTVTCSTGGSGQSIRVNAPPALTSSNASFNGSEFFLYSAPDVTGTANTTNSTVGGCTGDGQHGCVTWATGATFNVSGFPVGTLIKIGTSGGFDGAGNYVITCQPTATLLCVSPQPGAQTGVTYHASFGAWQQNRVGTDLACINGGSAGSAGTLNPLDCALAGNTAAAILATGSGPLAVPLDVSNPLIVSADGNGSSLEFGISMDNFSANCTNSSGVPSSLPGTQDPATLVFGNAWQEESYFQNFTWAGGCYQSYFYGSPNSPNSALRDGIVGGGPGNAGSAGFTGTVSTQNLSSGNCPANCVTYTSGSAKFQSNWAGSAITINSVAYTIAQVYTPTLLSLTTASGTQSGVSYSARGVFDIGVIDGTSNPGAGANGTTRLIENVSSSAKSGANIPANWLVSGPMALTEFNESHAEQLPTTGTDCFLATNGASPSVLGDKHQCTNSILHITASGSGAAFNVRTAAGANIAQDDTITAGSGNCNGNNSYCLNAGSLGSGSYSSLSGQAVNVLNLISSPPSGDNSTKVATTAWVQGQTAGIPWLTVPRAGANSGVTFSTSANQANLWGIVLTFPVTTTQITYFAGTPDNTANIYDVGIYDMTGTLKVHTGPKAGSTFAPAAGAYTLPWASSATLQPGKYYLAITTNCSSSCAALAGDNSSGVTFLSHAAVSVASGGTLSNSVTPPADAWNFSAYLPAWAVR
ncbi:MAG TPA: hypothetical protein VEF05_07985 [Terriglobales bacterium]|nr:hypothetical protein [Terriglobales bacterium]